MQKQNLSSILVNPSPILINLVGCEYCWYWWLNYSNWSFLYCSCHAT